MTIFAVTHVDDVHLIVDAEFDLIDRLEVKRRKREREEFLTALTREGIVSIVDNR